MSDSGLGIGRVRRLLRLAFSPRFSDCCTWALVLDVASARTLAWLATRGPGAELTADAHWFFYDRYSRLGAWHVKRGHEARARRLLAKARAHWEAAGGDGPPYAAAMALPRPRAWVRTDAVSRIELDGPDDAA